MEEREDEGTVTWRTIRPVLPILWDEVVVGAILRSGRSMYSLECGGSGELSRGHCASRPGTWVGHHVGICEDWSTEDSQAADV